MSELTHALEVVRNLPRNVLNRFPSGKWGFVGAVSVPLAYVSKDGTTPPTEEQLRIAHQYGPALANVRTRTWETREDAIAFAESLNLPITISK